MVCSRSIASVAICTAVSKPNVMSVPPRSLSIVFGTPSTGSAVLAVQAGGGAERVLAADGDQPLEVERRQFSAIRAGPSSRLNGLVRDERRMVPPRGRIPRVDSIVSSS